MPLTANQFTGFYMIGTSAMKELTTSAPTIPLSIHVLWKAVDWFHMMRKLIV